MGLHAYCITRASLEPCTTGIDGAPVQSVEAGTLAAWASSHASPPRPSIDALRAHDAVVRAATAPDLTPVPLRFGQWAESTDALRTRVGERAAHWEALLDEFAGAVEMGLRIGAATPLPHAPALPEPRPQSGREYLERLAARAHEQAHADARRADVLAVVHGALAAHVLREVSGGVPEGSELAWVAHLVLREHTDAYCEAVETLRRSAPGLRIRMTGPWPPYSFVT